MGAAGGGGGAGSTEGTEGAGGAEGAEGAAGVGGGAEEKEGDTVGKERAHAAPAETVPPAKRAKSSASFLPMSREAHGPTALCFRRRADLTCPAPPSPHPTS